MQRLKFQLPPVITRIYPEDPSLSPAASPGEASPQRLKPMAANASPGGPPGRRKGSNESRTTEFTELAGTPPTPRPSSASSASSADLPPPPRMPGPIDSPSPSPPLAVTVHAAPEPYALPNGNALTPRTITVQSSDPAFTPQPLHPPMSKTRRLLHPLSGIADAAWAQVDQAQPADGPGVSDDLPNGSAARPTSPGPSNNAKYLSKRRHTVSATASIAIDKLKAFFRRDSSAAGSGGGTGGGVDGRHDSVVTIGSTAFSDASRRDSTVSYAPSALGYGMDGRNSAAHQELSCLNAWCSDFFYCGKDPPPNSPQAMLEKHQCARFVTVITILVIIGVVIALIIKASRGES